MLDPLKIGILQDDVLVSLYAFQPELILCAGIILVLVLRLFTALNRWHLGWVALGFTVVALLSTADVQWQSAGQGQAPKVFSGLLVYDSFAISLRLFLFTFT